MKNVVVLGDKTSHGGTVISASSSFEIEGKLAALLNDKVSCPEHGTNPIVECDMNYDEGGKGIVIHGCKTACGAVMYCSARFIASRFERVYREMRISGRLRGVE